MQISKLFLLVLAAVSVSPALANKCKPGYMEINDKCVPCGAGTYSSSGIICAPCAPGSFNNMAGAASCKLCPPAYYSAEAGARACTQCPPNTATSVRGGATDCISMQ